VEDAPPVQIRACGVEQKKGGGHASMQLGQDGPNAWPGSTLIFLPISHAESLSTNDSNWAKWLQFIVFPGPSRASQCSSHTTAAMSSYHTPGNGWHETRASFSLLCSFLFPMRIARGVLRIPSSHRFGGDDNLLGCALYPKSLQHGILYT
jgi:hypothetical protein